MGDPLVSSEAKDRTSEGYRHSQMAEETRSVGKNYEFDRALWNITATFSREEKDNDKMWNSSFKNTGRPLCASTIILVPRLTLLLV